MLTNENIIHFWSALAFIHHIAWDLHLSLEPNYLYWYFIIKRLRIKQDGCEMISYILIFEMY